MALYTGLFVFLNLFIYSVVSNTNTSESFFEFESSETKDEEDSDLHARSVLQGTLRFFQNPLLPNFPLKTTIFKLIETLDGVLENHNQEIEVALWQSQPLQTKLIQIEEKMPQYIPHSCPCSLPSEDVIMRLLFQDPYFRETQEALRIKISKIEYALDGIHTGINHFAYKLDQANTAVNRLGRHVSRLEKDQRSVYF